MSELTSLLDEVLTEARLVELLSFRVAMVGLVLDDTWPGELAEAIDDVLTAVAALRREELARTIRTEVLAVRIGLATEPSLDALAIALPTNSAEKLRDAGEVLRACLDGLLAATETATSALSDRERRARRAGTLSVVLDGSSEHGRLQSVLAALVPQSLLRFLD